MNDVKGKLPSWITIYIITGFAAVNLSNNAHFFSQIEMCITHCSLLFPYSIKYCNCLGVVG